MMVLVINGVERARDVRLATSVKDKIIGLLFRKSMPDDEALFFPKINSIHTYGMQMNIDVLFLAGNLPRLEVVDVYRDVPPMRALRSRSADHTLELAAGAISRLGELPKYVELRDG